MEKKSAFNMKNVQVGNLLPTKISSRQFDPCENLTRTINLKISKRKNELETSKEDFL